MHFRVDSAAGLLSYSWKSRVLVIYKTTKQHAFNLAKFVSLYKVLLLLQRKVNGGEQRSADTFVAGLLGGYVVFGDRSAVNEQVFESSSVSSSIMLTRWLSLLDSPLCSISSHCFAHSTCWCSVFESTCRYICGQTNSARSTLFLLLRGSIMGCCDVVVPKPWGGYSTGHVQLYDLPLP